VVGFLNRIPTFPQSIPYTRHLKLPSTVFKTKRHGHENLPALTSYTTMLFEPTYSAHRLKLSTFLRAKDTWRQFWRAPGHSLYEQQHFM